MVFIRSFINAVTVHRLEYYLYYGLELSEEDAPLSLALPENDAPFLVISSSHFRFAARGGVRAAIAKYGATERPCLVDHVFNVAPSHPALQRVRLAEYSSRVTAALTKLSFPSCKYSEEYAEMCGPSLKCHSPDVRRATVVYHDSHGVESEDEELIPSDHEARGRVFRCGTALVVPLPCFEEMRPFLNLEYVKIGALNA